MVKGERPTVDGVRKALHRGSPNHIATCMQRFWKDQAALNAGDPITLIRLPPQLADAAVAQCERALRLAQQTAKHEGNAARAHLEQLRRDTELRSHSFDLREKEWDLAACARERALADAREHVNVLLKELAADRAELRARDARIADLESQLEDFRRQLATVIARAIAKNRTVAGHDAGATRTSSMCDVTPVVHVGFGAGVHACVGQMIARLEAEILLSELIRKVEQMEATGDPVLRLNNTLRSWDNLPVAVKAA